jgi:hypothetical protein
MNISVDLTGRLFNDYHGIDFYDSKTIFFDATTFLPKTVSFKVWGANVMPGFKWEDYVDVAALPTVQAALKRHSSQSITIQGFGTLTLSNVVAGRLSVTLLDGKEFLVDSNGRQVELLREWSLDAIDSSCHEYVIDEAKLYFPNGACTLQLFAKGSVTFEFNAQDCIDSVDYITNPNRGGTFYGFLKDTGLTTNSYRYEDYEPSQASG